MLRLWNTATRQIEEIKPITPGHIGLYTCGPTVYWDAHIGNMRSFVCEDILQRVLEAQGLAVRRVMNITDVGELNDAGEDKMLLGARREGKTVQEIAEMYTQRFLNDAKQLNIQIPPPPFLCKATEHIPEQIELVKALEAKGFTYQTSDGVYFDTSRFPSYGSFSGQTLEDKEGGARVAINPEKRNKTDFALWKFAPPQTERQLWPSPWGVGFPGWHLECSAMAKKYLGQPFDIHCGGVDHIPVHHENEIAQSEAAFGTPLARYWMHVEFLLVDDQKMSKSLGNVYTVSQIKEKGFDPLVFRLLVLGTHYRQKQNFTWTALRSSAQTLQKLQQAVRAWEAPSQSDEALLQEFLAAINDDLNTPKALAVLWKTIDSELPSAVKAATVTAMDQVLGLSLSEYIARPISVPSAVQDLMNQRREAREQKDWQASDHLRDQILAAGWTVEDGADGQRALPALPELPSV